MYGLSGSFLMTHFICCVLLHISNQLTTRHDSLARKQTYDSLVSFLLRIWQSIMVQMKMGMTSSK